MRSRPHPTIVGLALFAMIGVSSPAWSRQQPEAPEQINRTFEDPELDVDRFIERFETESREVFALREEIVDAVGLKPGMTVADIGAGTGLFTMLFAEAVGPEGLVLAVDIAPRFLNHIAQRAEDKGYEQIGTVLGTQASASLPAESIDVAYTCDTYHHFERPEEYLASIHTALKPDGRLIVIDFDRHEGASEFIQRHVRAPKEVFFQEIQAAGFVPEPVSNPPELKENFFAAFRKGRLAQPVGVQGVVD